MLETCRVGRVTCDRHVNILTPVDSYTLTNVVCAVAVNLCTGTVRVSDAVNNLQLTCIVIKLSLNVCEAVDTADDLCSILAKTVEDNAQRVLTNLVGHLSNLDSTLSSSERLVTCQESEALCLFAEQTGSEVAVAKTYLTVVSNRTTIGKMIFSV